MADTGNPWFIPFAEPSDLVRDWPALSSAVGTAVAAGLTAANAGGIGSNVVQAVKTDTFSTTSTSFVDVTGLTVTITPSEASSKVLVVAYLNIQNSADQAVYARLLRDAVVLSVGNTDGSRTSAATMAAGPLQTLGYGMNSPTVVLLDSPGVATATVYKVQMSVSGNTGFLNRTGDDANNLAYGRLISTITAIEVAA
jgi:hypothetical protein